MKEGSDSAWSLLDPARDDFHDPAGGSADLSDRVELRVRHPHVGAISGDGRAVFHSDLGSQYLSGDYRGLRERLGLRQSAGRVGTCFDNSAAESFWSSLKRELVHRYRFATREEAK